MSISFKSHFIFLFIALCMGLLVSSCGSNGKYNKVLKLLEEKDYKQVIEVCQKKIKSDPKDSTFHAYLGEAYLRTSEFEKAEEFYDKALELNPNVDWFHDELGITLTRLGKNKEAITHFNKSLKLNPDSKETPVALAYRSIAYYNLGDDQRAIADASKSIELHPENIMGYESRAKAYASMCEYQKAVDDANKLVELASKNPYSYVTRAYVHLSNNDPDSALEDAKKADDLKPDDGFISAALSDSYLEKKDYVTAEHLARKSVSLKPKNARVRVNLAKILLYQGKGAEARKEAAAALEQSPNSSSALLFQGLISAVNGDREKFTMYFDKFNKEYPEFTDSTLLTKSLGLIALGDYDGAVYNCSAFTEFRPKSSRIYRIRSEAYKRNGNDALAKKDYQKAIDHGYKADSQFEDILKIL